MCKYVALKLEICNEEVLKRGIRSRVSKSSNSGHLIQCDPRVTSVTKGNKPINPVINAHLSLLLIVIGPIDLVQTIIDILPKLFLNFGNNVFLQGTLWALGQVALACTLF